MTRFAIDAAIALQLIRDGRSSAGEHRLVAPSRLRSDVMSTLYDEVRAGRLDADSARRELEGLTELKIRLLGDRVSRATAWKLATRLGWAEVGPAEYLAVAILQADAFVTADEQLGSGAEGLVPIAGYRDLIG